MEDGGWLEDVVQMMKNEGRRVRRSKSFGWGRGSEKKWPLPRKLFPSHGSRRKEQPKLGTHLPHNLKARKLSSDY